MSKLFFFILKLGLLVALVVWLANQPGEVRIAWHGYLIETSAAFLAAGIFVLVAACLFVYRAVRFLRQGPRNMRLRNELKRLQKGQQKFTQGLMAVAAGDSAEAGRMAVAARKLLGATAATKLLQAQAAQLAGDRYTAEEIFTDLTHDPDGAVLGYRGLIATALRDGRFDDAAQWAEKFGAEHPKTPWLHTVRFELAARRSDWAEAASSLRLAAQYNLLDPAQARRQQAALLVAEAQSRAREGRGEEALQSAEKAVQILPDWMPGILELAKAQHRAGHTRLALKTIEKAWRRSAHIELAQFYRRLLDGDDALTQMKNIEKLCRNNPDDMASHMALAEAAMHARIWGEARRNLQILSRKVPDRKIFRMLADLERREHGNEAAAASWLAQAAEAPPEPQWICDNCGGTVPAWQAICPHCQALASINWQIPGHSRAAPVKLATAG